MEKAVTERGRWGKESGKCSTWFIPDIETESAIRNGYRLERLQGV